jgi:hypothetical protein
MNWFRRYMIAAGLVVVAGLGAVQIIGHGAATEQQPPYRPAQYGPEWSPIADRKGHWIGWIDDASWPITVPTSSEQQAQSGWTADAYRVVWNDDGEPIGLLTSVGFIEARLSPDGTQISDPAVIAELTRLSIDDTVVATVAESEPD